MIKEKVIFFGNGKLAEYALSVLARECQVIFHARTKEDLAKAVEIKKSTPEAHAVLASYGVMVPERVLAEFEPEGILNIHPSLLPKYRGASPIESAILAGDTDFSVSVMKLVKAMDAGPIYYQETFSNLPLNKDAIYQALAEAGAEWIVKNLAHLPASVPQDGQEATFTAKLTKEMGLLTPDIDTAEETLRKIVAYQDFPKAKYTFFGKNCAILEAHIVQKGEIAVLPLPCANDSVLSIDRLQPDGKRPMDAKSFLNGYKR